MIDFSIESRDRSMSISIEREERFSDKSAVVLNRISFCSSNMTIEQAEKFCKKLLSFGIDCKITRIGDKVCVVGEKISISR
ncbi:MAG: hypothetical protein QXL14_00380 [Candidatus Aenigmatarchaeota archaeon]